MTPEVERAPGQGHPAPWLIPAVAVLAVFYAVPVLDVARLAVSDATLIQPARGVSTAALRSILTDPALPQVLGTTLVFVAVNVAVLQLAGLAIALLIVRGERRDLPGGRALRRRRLRHRHLRSGFRVPRGELRGRVRRRGVSGG